MPPVTPFDVVRLRLQTQNLQESLFIPSSHLPPPTQNPATSAQWKGKGERASTHDKPPTDAARPLSRRHQPRDLLPKDLLYDQFCKQEGYSVSVRSERRSKGRFDSYRTDCSILHPSVPPASVGSREIDPDVVVGPVSRRCRDSCSRQCRSTVSIPISSCRSGASSADDGPCSSAFYRPH